MPSTFSVCGSLLLHFVGFMTGLQLQLIIWLHFYVIPQERGRAQLLAKNFDDGMRLLNLPKVIIVSGPIFFIVTASLGWKHAFGNSETV